MPSVTHKEVVAQATFARLSRSATGGTLGLAGAVGSKVTARALASTAVHWVVDAHATPAMYWGLASMRFCCGVPGVAGSKVTSWPLRSTSTHSLVLGQARY